MSNFGIFSHNGQTKPIEQANVSLSQIEYQYGFGVYETLKIRHSKLFFVNKHVKRLIQSAQMIGIRSINFFDSVMKIEDSSPRLEKSLVTFVNELKEEALNLKVLLIGNLSTDSSDLYILPLAPIFPDKKLYRHGAYLVSCEYERYLPKAKTLNMLGSFLAYKKAKEVGAYDALLINKDKKIIEGTRTNFFLIRDKNIFTPASEFVLEGVTRETVLETAEKNGYKVVYESFGLNDLTDFDGAFLTSTSSKIIPVKRIDNFEFKQVPESITYLMKLYDEFLNCYNEL